MSLTSDDIIDGLIGLGAVALLGGAIVLALAAGSTNQSSSSTSPPAAKKEEEEEGDEDSTDDRPRCRMCGKPASKLYAGLCVSCDY